MATVPKMRARTLTEQAIEAAIDSDKGNRFRMLLLKHLPRIADAYRQDDDTDDFRSHLGASQIGNECERALFYMWRWAAIRSFPARILRLFNRGHMEEARFLALLELIDVQFHQPEDGGQERVSAFGGHFGSALDGVLWNVPDCPGEWVLGEFKTHNTKSFSALFSRNSVAACKPEHYAQMQACMHLRGIHKCLYMAVNKNDDDIYCEVVHYNHTVAKKILEKGHRIIFADKAPDRLSKDPSHFVCSYCDLNRVCHYEQTPVRNCRTCEFSAPVADGTWGCETHQRVIDKETQLRGCDKYVLMQTLRG